MSGPMSCLYPPHTVPDPIRRHIRFLNPFVYRNADAFFDVVTGTNAIGRGTGPLEYGFNCTRGWDPATGVGTPHFGKLLAAAMGTADS